MMTSEQRSVLDEEIRRSIRLALQSGATKTEIVFLLTRMLPELDEQSRVHGQVMAAYDLARVTA